MTYIGRFAPSPTGNLHFGSLVSALASFLDARHHNGQWLVRIEDMDPPREQAGADRAILHALQTYGLQWDGEVLYQSSNHHRYYHLLDKLQERGLLYHCRCTRARLKTLNNCYDRHCRSLALSADNNATRLMVDQPVYWDDIIQGEQSFDHAAIGGDFIVIRRDLLISYQIAVSVDDHEQGITHVVRGADLLQSTARQRYIMQLMGWKLPNYAHVPLATHSNGDKLSKQTAAPELPLGGTPIRSTLIAALQFLNQDPPKELAEKSIDHILNWAISHWCIDDITKQTEKIAL